MYLTYEELKGYIIKLQEENRKRYNIRTRNLNSYSKIDVVISLDTSNDFNLQYIPADIVLRLCNEGVLTGAKRRVQYYEAHTSIMFYRIYNLVSRHRSHKGASVMPIYSSNPVCKAVRKKHNLDPRVYKLTRSIYNTL